jgi:hypothetical protein
LVLGCAADCLKYSSLIGCISAGEISGLVSVGGGDCAFFAPSEAGDRVAGGGAAVAPGVAVHGAASGVAVAAARTNKSELT